MRCSEKKNAIHIWSRSIPPHVAGHRPQSANWKPVRSLQNPRATKLCTLVTGLLHAPPGDVQQRADSATGRAGAEVSKKIQHWR
jgi:hypothetical protein